ncbi:DUF4238 domain-containing protein [Bacillus sp. MN7755]
MSKKKKQHFVPRFYLKMFSNNLDQKTIGIFNVEREMFIAKGNLKNQAYKDYFYGKDGRIEDGLGKLEGEASKLFYKILSEKFMPAYLSNDYYLMLIFTIFLAVRTEHSADTQNEFLDKAVKTIFKDDPRVKERLDDFTVKHVNAPAFILSVAAKMLPVASDLKCKLIFNRTNRAFITSDNPVVKYNQFLEHRNSHGSNLGFATKGLQIFFPLSPKVYLVFYDGDTYKVGNKKNDIVWLDNERDIRELNILQCVNAYKNIYFNQDMDELTAKKVYLKATEYRHDIKANVNEYKALENRNRALIHMYGQDKKMNLRLNFIKELKKARKYNLGNKTVHVRSEELLKVAKDFEEYMDKQSV